MNNNDEIYFELDVGKFEKIKPEAIKKADEDCEKGDEGKKLLLDNLKLESKPSERFFDIEKNVFTFSGSLLNKDDDEIIGYMSLDLAMDTNTLLDLIQMYIKKLQRVKTVMESVKEE